MQGKTHSIMGLSAGLWAPRFAGGFAASAAPLLPGTTATSSLQSAAAVSGNPVAALAFGITTAAFAIIPDWDTGKSLGTTMWGPVSRVLTAPVRWVFDHRGGTHNPVLAPLVFAVLVVPHITAGITALVASVLAWFVGGSLPPGAVGFWTSPAALVPYVAAGTVAVTVGLAVAGLSATVPGPWRWWPVNLAVSVAAGFSALATDAVPLWLPWAAGFGVLVHLVGDRINSAGLTYGGAGETAVYVALILSVVLWVDVVTGWGIIASVFDATSRFVFRVTG